MLVKDYDHRVDWEAAWVIDQEPLYWPRRIMEATANAKRSCNKRFKCHVYKRISSLGLIHTRAVNLNCVVVHYDFV